MVKEYTFEEFRWHFLSVEVDKFDLRKKRDRIRYEAKQLYDLGRRMARESLGETNIEEFVEEREVKEGKIIKILCIRYPKISSSYGFSCSLKSVA